MALSIALMFQNADSLEKAVVLTALVISHLPADAIPHGHYSSLSKLLQTRLGSIIEPCISIISLTWLVWHITSANILWLIGCVIATNLFDFLYFVGIGFIKRLNHFAHWWDKNYDYPNKLRWQWEAIQTIVLLTFLTLSILKYG